MAARPIQRNNVIAGLFLIGSLVLTVLVSFALSDAAERFGDFRTYTFRFDVDEGVAGVQIGSPVTLGGLAVGRVTSVTPIYSDDSSGVSLPLSLDLGVSIDERVQLYTNAEAYVVTPILGTLATVNINHPGGPDKPPPVVPTGMPVPDASLATLLAPDEPLDGAIAPALLAQAGLGPRESQLIRETLTDARLGVGTFRELADRLRPVVEQGSVDVQETLTSFRSTAARLDERSDEIADNLAVITSDVRDASGRLDLTMDEIDRGLADARRAIETANAILDENRPGIRRSAESVERVISRVELQTVDKLEAVLDEGLIAAGNFADTGARAESILIEAGPSVRRAVANARVITDQASLFLQEVRAAPWRLLERPGDKQLREQLLYDATRNYASAVGDLALASESLDAALAAVEAARDSASVGDAIDPDGLAQLAGDVRRAFGAYQRAEGRLLELVSDGALAPTESR